MLNLLSQMDRIGKKEKHMELYESPSIEIIEIIVEVGFAGSISGGLGETGNMAGSGDVNIDW